MYCTLFAQQPDSTKKLPAAHWARTRKIDIRHIALDLRFDWSQKQASGTASITLNPLYPLDKITLDAGMLAIHSIVLSNGKSLTFNYDGGDRDDGLEITLDRRYRAGETLTIRIDYHTNWANASDPNNLWGSFGKGLRFFEPTSTDPKKRRQIWSAGDPASNRYWFPGYDAPDDWRTSELTATVDKNLTVVSNGKRVETKTNPDGTRTVRWKMDIPYANHLTSLVIGEYVDIPQNHQGIQLHHYGYPDETAATRASVVRLPDMVRYFSEKTGVLYPYPAYSQVFVQDFAGFMSNAATSTITENMVDDDRTHAEFFYLWDLTEAEALARQWFGAYLSCRDWSHAWLDKAFAHYFNCLYNEHKNGRAEMLLYQRLFDLNTVYLGDWNAGVRRPVVTRHYDDATAFTGDNYTTTRGALVLHLLRKHLGEENWWKAIRYYLQSNAGHPVTTEDFQKAVETTSGKPMGWFFDQWIYKMGHPVFEIAKYYDTDKQQLILQVKQTQKTDPNDPYPQVKFFEGKVEIEIDGTIETVWLQPQADNAFVFAAAQSPKLVNFDYEGTWIKEIRFEKPLDELLYQLQNDRDVLGQRWAMGELVQLARNAQTSAADQAKIHAGLRSVIGSKTYWRLRYAAMQQLQSLLAPAASTAPVLLDGATTDLLRSVIQNERAWNRAQAISFLGTTRDSQFADLYRSAFNDSSDRVINAAAIALGKTKSPQAFDALAKLRSKPSWKNQSLISALYGLKELGDPRGADIAFEALSDLNSPHWTLATPVWDYRMTAATTLAALGKSEVAYPLIFTAFQKAMDENDVHGIFYNVLLINTLADARGLEVFEPLKVKFKDDPNVLAAIQQYESQFKDAIKK